MWKNVDKMWKMWKKNAYLIQKRNKIMHFFWKKVHKIFVNYAVRFFSRSDSLKRHLSLCKLNNKQKMELKYPEVSKNVEKKCISQNFKCQFCQNEYKSNRGLSKHIKNCWLRNKIHQEHDQHTKLLEKDLETKEIIIKNQQETIKTVKEMKPSVTHITHNNSTNKTINYLNTQYGEMIAMEKFLHNLQYEEQLTTEECRKLLASYKDSGIELFARSFSHVMKKTVVGNYSSRDSQKWI